VPPQRNSPPKAKPQLLPPRRLENNFDSKPHFLRTVMPNADEITDRHG